MAAENWNRTWTIRGGELPDAKDLPGIALRMRLVLSTWTNVRMFRNERVLENFKADVNILGSDFALNGTSPMTLEETQSVLTELAVVMKSALNPSFLEFELAGKTLSVNKHGVQ